MPNLLKDGLAWLTSQLAASASDEVTYVRGSDSAVVRATFGRKPMSLDDGEGGIRTEFENLDFLIPAADLVLSGVPVRPERGDTIEVAVAYGTEVYQVFPVGAEAPWRWADPMGETMLRVHTRLIEGDPYS